MGAHISEVAPSTAPPRTRERRPQPRPPVAVGPGGVTVSALASDCARLIAADRLDALETPRDEAFDRITQLAKKLFHVPIAVVSFVESPHQWNASSQEAIGGRPTGASARRDDRPLVIADATMDGRLACNPFVARRHGVRFYAGFPLVTGDGRNLGSLCLVDVVPRDFSAEEAEILGDLAQLVVDELELRLSSVKDGLTGALSRRSFKDEAHRAIALALRHDYQLSCLAIDLDHFKSINDTYGHAAGDLVLGQTIRACAEELRTTDFIGRMGGEEFAVLLPHTGLAGALDVAERLRASIANLRIVTPAQVINVTASFGVAALCPAAGDIDALLANADHALYKAKRCGRNRCVAWQPESGAAPAASTG